jgi:hypothetical protein
LYALRDSNSSSRLVANWTDSKQPESWQGVRWENGIVTGLWVNQLHIALLEYLQCPAVVEALQTCVSESTSCLLCRALTALMLGSIPPEVGELRGLQCLMLSSNRITTLPTVVSELQGLTSL